MTRYLVCRTCGKYVGAASAVNRAYCSEDCALSFDACTTCGRYFARDTGFDAGHCSRECTVRYQIFRRYGPEPVTVVTEV